MTKRILIFIALIATAIMFYSFTKEEKPSIENKQEIVEKKEGDSVFLKGYTFEKPDGTMFSFEEVKGKIILLDFWATWCGPCIRDYPNVLALEEELNNPKFVVITVSVDKNKQKWKDFIVNKKRKGINIILDLKDRDNPLNKMVVEKVKVRNKVFEKISVPKYYLIDKNLKKLKIKKVSSEQTKNLARTKLKELE